MFDATIHLGDLLVAAGSVGGFLWAGGRVAAIFRDDVRGLKQTVYGSEQPPVEGLVKVVERHEEVISRFNFLKGPGQTTR